MPHKVLYNASYGGFSLSEEMERILNHLGLDPDTIARHDPRLIDLVQEIGIENAGAQVAILRLRPLTQVNIVSKNTMVSRQLSSHKIYSGLMQQVINLNDAGYISG